MLDGRTELVIAEPLETRRELGPRAPHSQHRRRRARRRALRGADGENTARPQAISIRSEMRSPCEKKAPRCCLNDADAIMIYLGDRADGCAPATAPPTPIRRMPTKPRGVNRSHVARSTASARTSRRARCRSMTRAREYFSHEIDRGPDCDRDEQEAHPQNHPLDDGFRELLLVPTHESDEPGSMRRRLHPRTRRTEPRMIPVIVTICRE